MSVSPIFSKLSINFLPTIFMCAPVSEPKKRLSSSDLKVDDDKLSKMLDTIMGEANEIRSGRPKSTSSSGSS